MRADDLNTPQAGHEMISESDFQTSYPSIEATLQGDKQVAQWDKYIMKMATALDAGELIKSEFAEIKYINRFIEAAVTKSLREPYWHSGAYESLPEHLMYDLDTSNVAMHTLPGKLKKALALQKKGDAEVLHVYIDLMNELMPLHLAQKELKGMIVSKKRADVEKKAAKDTYTKGVMEHKDVLRVQDVLTKVTQQLRDKIFQSNLDYVESVINHFWNNYDPENHRKTNNYEVNKRNPFIREIVGLSIAKGTKYGRDDPDTLAEDTKQKATAYAKRMTDDVLTHFISKQTAKMAEILVKKDNLKTIDLKNARTGSGAIEADLKLVFQDDSNFLVTNKLVWSVSKLGKTFYRFPTTFHNVHFPNGDKMKGAASEKRMDTEFAVA